MRKLYSATLTIKGNDNTSWFLDGSVVCYYAERILDKSHKLGSNLLFPMNERTTEDLLWLMERFNIQVDEKFTDIWNEEVQKMHEFLSQHQRIITANPFKPSDTTFHGTLKEYQKIGVDFMLKANGSVLLADEMGLGKGVEALAFLSSKKDAFPALIIAPLTVLEHWNREIKRFLTDADGKHLKVEKIRPPLSNTLVTDADIYLINYDLIFRAKDLLTPIPLRTIILDEIQGIRHAGTKKKIAIDELSKSIEYRIGLSGTPIHNYATEIYNIIDWIRPGFLGNYGMFFAQYFVFGNGINALREDLSRNLMIRRRKAEVLKELPPKSRIYQVIDIDRNRYESKLRAEINKIRDTMQSMERYPDFMRKEMLLKMLDSVPETERELAGLSKLESIKQFVDETLELDDPVVVYCHHLAVHDALHREFFYRRPASIVGGQKDELRQKNIDKFQSGETNMMIAGLRAGSLGINLTTAANVIFAELDWSPAIHWQAEDRLHRIGQQKPVFSYYMVGKGTLDERLSEVLAAKANQFEMLFGDTLDGFMNVEADFKHALLERFLDHSDMKEMDRILNAKKPEVKVGGDRDDQP